MRKPLIAGNWKMHKTVDESLLTVRELVDYTGNIEDREILICPPFLSLLALREFLDDAGSSISIGAQNCHFKDSGAFTGEVSPEMLSSIGVDYVIVGHSERREIFLEKDDFINKKVHSAIVKEIVPILCVGETLEERERGETETKVSRQVSECLKGIGSEYAGKFVIAYEPIWAIGTGLNATPDDARSVVELIRMLLENNIGKNAAETTRILYGGSVKPDNINDLMSQEGIDGVLVGGASLKAKDFADIVLYDINR